MDMLSHVNWQLVSNISMIALLTFLAFYFFVLLIERRKREKLLNLHKKKNSAQKIGDRVQVIQDFYQEIEEIMKRRGNEAVADFVFYGLIIIAGAVAFGMIMIQQFLLAIVYPLLFLWVVRKIIQTAQKDPIIELEEGLPATIDNMIRIFSKYNDVKTIVYETSLVTRGPLQKELESLSIKMNSRSPYVVLEDFAEKHNSVWMNSFAFTLIGYLQDSSKEETIQNLRHLRKILEQENTSKKKAISERKPSLMINYALAAIGVVGGFANIAFNPNASEFFFHSYLGLFCFTVGFGFVLGTIYMNVKMMKIEK